MQKHKRIIEKRRAKHISIKSRETIKQRKTVSTATAADNLKDGWSNEDMQQTKHHVDETAKQNEVRTQWSSMLKGSYKSYFFTGNSSCKLIDTKSTMKK